MSKNGADKEYFNLLDDIFENGEIRDDRTGTGTLAVFGRQMRFDLQKGFPLLTTKKISFKNVAVELLWFLRGETDILYLLDNNVNIWNKDAYRHYKNTTTEKEDDIMTYKEFVEYAKEFGFVLDNVYPKQWMCWQPAGLMLDPYFDTREMMLTDEYINQLQNVVESIKNDPYSRRHLVSAWNVGELDEMALPPCHYAFQFDVTSSGKLNCLVNIRSNDIFLGNPYNIASYALLTHIVAKMTDLEVGELILSIGNAHLYLNHLEQAREQLSRSHRPLPTLTVKSKKENIDEYSLDDFDLVGYDPHPAIKADLSVGE